MEEKKKPTKKDGAGSFINWDGWRLMHKGGVYGLQSFLFFLKMVCCIDRSSELLERRQNWKRCDSSLSSQHRVSEVNDFCMKHINTPGGCDKNVKTSWTGQQILSIYLSYLWWQTAIWNQNFMFPWSTTTTFFSTFWAFHDSFRPTHMTVTLTAGFSPFPMSFFCNYRKCF